MCNGLLFLFKSNKTKANLAAHALCQFSIRENHLISERERETERERQRQRQRQRGRGEQTQDRGQRQTESAYVCGNQNPSWLL